ncbi:unnamed protein product [Adineta steineri]|uniref:Uncharacterized protein n=1 Tax=Adineta steineri TaxID=433720 RepID=A0A813QGD4_9BILA|nr:unnamed protein product [Adineta steineri]CAF3522264.1 unnamed protein product [Adineta steineri]
MNRDGHQLYYASRRERLLALLILLLILMSFFLHLSSFADIMFKNFDLANNQTKIKQNNDTTLLNNKSIDDIFDINLLPFFCILAHLIWTIVLLVALDQCCIFNNKSIHKVLFKLFICTCPLLLCSELSIVFVFHINGVKNDLLFITIKWLLFIGTILISFWTGVISDKDKWRGIHGGQIAPEHNTPLYLFQN